MLGWIICREGKGRPTLERRCVGGVWFWVLEGPPAVGWRQRRLWNAALREMARRGVHRAVLQGVDAAIPAACGIIAVDSVGLRRSLLPQLLSWVDREWGLQLGSAAVLLSADSSGTDTWHAAVELSRRARYVTLDTGPGQAILEEELRSTLGLGTGGGRQVLEVCLAAEARGGLPTLYLGHGCGGQQHLTLAAPGLEGVEESMLCALFQAEKLPIQDIQVRFVEFRA